MPNPQTQSPLDYQKQNKKQKRGYAGDISTGLRIWISQPIFRFNLFRFLRRMSS